MSRQAMAGDFVVFIPHAIESDWDDVDAPRLERFPVNLCYAEWIQGAGMASATSFFDPGTFVDGPQSRQIRYPPTVDSDFSVLVVRYRDGGIDTFRYRGSEMISEASGPHLRTTMIHTTACGDASV